MGFPSDRAAAPFDDDARSDRGQQFSCIQCLLAVCRQKDVSVPAPATQSRCVRRSRLALTLASISENLPSALIDGGVPGVTGPCGRLAQRHQQRKLTSYWLARS
jgi:hypothetical protein